jgi:phage tail sheath protein FI
MAVQVSYPGVYIDEFEPGAPIEGVGTNTAVFLGVAPRGPMNTATLITNWDAFTRTFGSFLPDKDAWLARGVYGFFLNGGTRCYVVRVSTGAKAVATLAARGAGNAVVATAFAEGLAGNNIAVKVADSSRSADAVRKAMTRKITAVDATKKKLTVQGGLADLAPGQPVHVRLGTNVENGTIAAVNQPAEVVLQAALTNDYTGGTVEGDFAVQVLVAGSAVQSTSGDRSQLTLASTQGFAPGDFVHVEEAANHIDVLVTDVTGNVLTVAPPVDRDYAGGTARTADLKHGGTVVRLHVPAALSVPAAFPPGSLVQIGTKFARVGAAGGDAIQLDANGLPDDIALTDQTNAPAVSTADFDLTLTPPSAGSTPESFQFLSSDQRSPGYLGNVVSTLVTFAPADPLGTPDANGDDRPTAGTKSTSGAVGDDPAASWTALAADPNKYLQPLGKLRDVSLLAIPGAVDPVVQQAMRDHCESLQDRFAILDCTAGLDATGITTQFAAVRSAKGYAALYYPRIVVRDPSTGKNAVWPTSGHLAGVYARTDETRGVHKAPANVDIRGAVDIESTGVLSDHEQGPLNKMGINVLRTFPGQSQPIVWGARTTAGDLDTNWQYVNVRRLFIYLEQSIERGIRWAVFEPNDLALWQKLKRSITDFLTQAWRDGALFGAKAEEAFYVRIDEALNPPATQALGRLYIEVGLAPTYPAEFIVLRIGIWRDGSESSTS